MRVHCIALRPKATEPMRIPVLVLLLICTFAFSQTDTASLKGTVVTADQKPLKGVMVVATNSAADYRHATVTDQTGHYLFSDIPPGAYRIEAHNPDGTTIDGYNVEVKAGNVTDAGPALCSCGKKAAASSVSRPATAGTKSRAARQAAAAAPRRQQGCTPLDQQIDVQLEWVKKPTCEDEARAGFRNNYSEPVACVFRWSETSPPGHVTLPVGVAVSGDEMIKCNAQPQKFRFVCFPESQAKNGCENRVTWPK